MSVGGPTVIACGVPWDSVGEASLSDSLFFKTLDNFCGLMPGMQIWAIGGKQFLWTFRSVFSCFYFLVPKKLFSVYYSQVSRYEMNGSKWQNYWNHNPLPPVRGRLSLTSHLQPQILSHFYFFMHFQHLRCPKSGGSVFQSFGYDALIWTKKCGYFSLTSGSSMDLSKGRRGSDDMTARWMVAAGKGN